MPMTREMLRELSGKPPDNSLAVSEVVARGAAIHAGIVAARRQDRAASGRSGAGRRPGRHRRDQRQLAQPGHRGSSRRGARQRHPDPQEHAAAHRRQPGLPHGRARTSRACASRCCRARPTRPTRASASANAGSRPARQPAARLAPIQVRCGVGSNGLIDVMALDMTSGKMARAEIHRTSGLPTRRSPARRSGCRGCGFSDPAAKSGNHHRRVNGTRDPDRATQVKVPGSHDAAQHVHAGDGPGPFGPRRRVACVSQVAPTDGQKGVQPNPLVDPGRRGPSGPGCCPGRGGPAGRPRRPRRRAG